LPSPAIWDFDGSDIDAKQINGFTNKSTNSLLQSGKPIAMLSIKDYFRIFEIKIFITPCSTITNKFHIEMGIFFNIMKLIYYAQASIDEEALVG